MVSCVTFWSFFAFFGVHVAVNSLIASRCNFSCTNFFNFCSIRIHCLNLVCYSSHAKSLFDLSLSSSLNPHTVNVSFQARVANLISGLMHYYIKKSLKYCDHSLRIILLLETSMLQLKEPKER